LTSITTTRITFERSNYSRASWHTTMLLGNQSRVLLINSYLNISACTRSVGIFGTARSCYTHVLWGI